MKLKATWINVNDLQENLDRYQEKIIHIVWCKQYVSDINAGCQLILIIDES